MTDDRFDPEKTHRRFVRLAETLSPALAADLATAGPLARPDGDAAVARTFARYIGRRKPARTAARFAPQRSALALYMWAIIDRIP